MKRGDIPGSKGTVLQYRVLADTMRETFLKSSDFMSGLEDAEIQAMDNLFQVGGT
ncbi:MAG: hypothetical protein D084_Lepto4C00347G0004 [Leptospirillum sp. Group IV 'UBA BS']|nr:MAG: hypothetical protein D084_Lepto4C00347G0004 [Leptospirillum sp. Group IV 'UBA BS']